MAHYALWLDHQYAYIYKFTATDVEERTLKAHPYDGSTSFYHAVAEGLTDAEELMVMGPGVAKDEFKHHCESNHYGTVARAIRGVRPMAGHPTKAMMIHEAQDFFKHLHTWTANY